MFETIVTTFDPSILPAWAQADRYVRWLAERNLDFRAQVCSAHQQSEAWQIIAKREARRRYEQE